MTGCLQDTVFLENVCIDAVFSREEARAFRSCILFCYIDLIMQICRAFAIRIPWEIKIFWLKLVLSSFIPGWLEIISNCVIIRNHLNWDRRYFEYIIAQEILKRDH